MTSITSETALRRLHLWFFRDLSDAQRTGLLRLCFHPATEFDTHTSQQIALNKIIDILRSPQPTPELLVANEARTASLEYALLEIIGTADEYKAMPCNSLERRFFFSTVDRYRSVLESKA